MAYRFSIPMKICTFFSWRDINGRFAPWERYTHRERRYFKEIISYRTNDISIRPNPRQSRNETISNKKTFQEKNISLIR